MRSQNDEEYTVICLLCCIEKYTQLISLIYNEELDKWLFYTDNIITTYLHSCPIVIKQIFLKRNAELTNKEGYYTSFDITKVKQKTREDLKTDVSTITKSGTTVESEAKILISVELILKIEFDRELQSHTLRQYLHGNNNKKKRKRNGICYTRVSIIRFIF